MSDTASLENCKELAEISGWLTNEDADHYWYKNEAGEFEIRTQEESEFYHADEYYPLYTAGYLLRKLPKTFDGYFLILEANTKGKYSAYYLTNDYTDKRPMDKFFFMDEEPVNALCKLAIELHKKGIFPISGRD